MDFVVGNEALLAGMQAFIDTVLELAGPVHTTVKLAQGTFNPVPGSDPASFEEATFTGYAAKEVTGWSDPYLVEGQSAETVSTAVLHWSPTGTAVENTIVGLWAIAADGSYLGGQKFDDPIPMGQVTDAINIVPKYRSSPATFSFDPIL